MAETLKIPVLVVDDDPFLRDVLQRFLQRKDYTIAMAEDADEAIAYARDIPFTVAIVDIFIHGMDGIELANELKRINPALIVIIMTGHPSLDSALSALKQGVQDYLIKPFSLDQLEESIQRCLRERKILEENSELKKNIEALEDKIREYEKIIRQSHVVHQHAAAEMKKQKARGDAVYRDQSGQNVADTLERLLRLKEEGVISEDEYTLRRDTLKGTE